MFTGGLAVWWMDKVDLFFNYRLLHICGGKFIRKEGELGDNKVEEKVEEKQEEKMTLDGGSAWCE